MQAWSVELHGGKTVGQIRKGLAVAAGAYATTATIENGKANRENRTCTMAPSSDWSPSVVVVGRQTKPGNAWLLRRELAFFSTIYERCVAFPPHPRHVASTGPRHRSTHKARRQVHRDPARQFSRPAMEPERPPKEGAPDAEQRRGATRAPEIEPTPKAPFNL